MVHLNGQCYDQKLSEALREVDIFHKHGVDGIIIENYHGTQDDVRGVLEELHNTVDNIKVGVNILTSRDRRSFQGFKSFEYAERYGADFVQFDSVQSGHINVAEYAQIRAKHPRIAVLGGVRFKYQTPLNLTLEEEIEDAKSRCEAIVTTGDGTGIETPLSKLESFKQYLPKFPLISGAGVNLSNVREQFKFADAVIVGSYFKNGITQNKVEEDRVASFMNEVRKVRESY